MPENTGLQYNSLFVDPTETYICALGEQLAGDYIDKGLLSDGFAVLTDERIYTKGTYFARVGKKYLRTNDDLVVNANDVSDMDIVYYNPLKFMAVAIVLLIVSYIAIILGASGYRYFTTAFSITTCIIFIIAVLVLSVIYSANRHMLFEICLFGGSAIAYKYELLNDDEMKEFKNSIELIKNAGKMLLEEILDADTLVESSGAESDDSVPDDRNTNEMVNDGIRDDYKENDISDYASHIDGFENGFHNKTKAEA